jgi:CBS domain containing-hemolysin-like protein
MSDARHLLALQGSAPVRPLRPALSRLGLLLALAPALAHASFLQGEALDSLANGLAIFILFAVPIGGLVLFWLVHILPEKVAEKRHHPQKDAIKTLCLLSLVFGGLLWPFAWLWAYSKPVVHKLAYGTDKHEDYYRELAEKEGQEADAIADDVARMRDELSVLVQRGARPEDLAAMRERLAVIEAKLHAVSAKN